MNTNKSNTNRKRVLRNVAVAGTATAAWVLTLAATPGVASVVAMWDEKSNHNETLLRPGRP